MSIKIERGSFVRMRCPPDVVAQCHLSTLEQGNTGLAQIIHPVITGSVCVQGGPGQVATN